MDITDYNNRRTVYLACLGIDIYMLALYMVQSALVTGGLFIIDIFPELTDYAGLLDGLIAISSVFFGLILLWLYTHEVRDEGLLFDGRKPIEAIKERNKPFSLRMCVILALMLFAVQIASSLMLNLTEVILNIFGLTVNESPAMNADYTGNILLILYVVLVGPAVEELVFRGFLLKSLMRYGRFYAIVISALMFSLMHGDIQQLLFTFLAGLIMGYAAAEYSLLASFILHVINNALYGEVLANLGDYVSYNAYIMIMFAVMVISIVISIAVLIRNRSRIRAYIIEHRAPKGAYAALKNRWFIAYAVCMLALTWGTITKL